LKDKSKKSFQDFHSEKTLEKNILFQPGKTSAQTFLIFSFKKHFFIFSFLEKQVRRDQGDRLWVPGGRTAHRQKMTSSAESCGSPLLSAQWKTREFCRLGLRNPLPNRRCPTFFSEVPVEVEGRLESFKGQNNVRPPNNCGRRQ